MAFSLPSGPGLAIFPGGGAWKPPLPWSRASSGAPAGGTLVLSDPVHTLVAGVPHEIPGLLDELEAEQDKGNYVAGYLAYEAGSAFGLTARPLGPDALPLAWMAVYQPEAVTIIPAVEWRRLLTEVDTSRVAAALAQVSPRLNVSRDEYVEGVRRVREYIAAGDTYQVNYTLRARFELGLPEPALAPASAADAVIHPLVYFLALLVRQPVPYAAYLDLGDAQVLSLSPELLLRRQAARLESRPMKGTRPRGATHAEDVALAYELAETEKERAENLMIVDMVRNDLGRVCRAGSVQVPTLYAVEPYRTVWQMVSTVTGDVNPRAGLAEIMQAVFPGASVTGAPKHHTMEIIADLETEPREVYTGAVGLFLPAGDFTANVAIRTIVHRRGACKLGVGSGVVWDSNASAEYDEVLVKAAFATPPATATPPRGGPWRPDPATQLGATIAAQEDFHLFETVLLETSEEGTSTDRGAGPQLEASRSLGDDAVLTRYAFLNEHLERMASSARVLRLPFEPAAAREVMLGLARVTPGAIVARIQLDAAGDVSISTREAPAAVSRPVTLLVSPFRTDPDDPLLRHKTSVRGFYDREHRRALGSGHFDALFLNRLDLVTEGAITNLFARYGQEWTTPPLTDGLLPGLWRAWFLQHTAATERSLTLNDLLSADEVVVGNSVRGSASVGRLIVEPLIC